MLTWKAVYEDSNNGVDRADSRLVSDCDIGLRHMCIVVSLVTVSHRAVTHVHRRFVIFDAKPRSVYDTCCRVLHKLQACSRVVSDSEPDGVDMCAS